MSEATNSKAPSNTKTPRTFYRRTLPEICKAFASEEGKALFRSAMQHNGLKSFYSLIEQHSTQSEPSYCGLSTLVIALNALSVDPRKAWKGPWRWYEESMLSCCIDLEGAKGTGITLAQFHCLAKCQGLVSKLHYVDTDGMQHHDGAGQTIAVNGMDRFRDAVEQACMETQQPTANQILVVSYARKVLQQTGSGHFSPIAAYDSVSDHVLILDTARFKYGTHWVPLSLLYEAMQPIDSDTQRSRGYALLSVPNDQNSNNSSYAYQPVIQQPIVLCLSQKQKAHRLPFKHYLNQLQEEPHYSDILNFFTWNDKRIGSVWNLTEVQLKPLDDNDPDGTIRKVVDDVLGLIEQFLAKEQNRNGDDDAPPNQSTLMVLGDDCENQHCRSNFCRSIPLTPHQAVFLVYLAALSRPRRQELVHNTSKPSIMEMESFEIAKQQLLAEAEFLRIAIDMSDSKEL